MMLKDVQLNIFVHIIILKTKLISVLLAKEVRRHSRLIWNDVYILYMYLYYILLVFHILCFANVIGIILLSISNPYYLLSLSMATSRDFMVNRHTF